uniref:Transmembrane and ubiquitin-like domain-containing protein 1 n=1 Tax=Phallusia mammillata TaxID=59560 RepID=A0A6F9DVU0_9ASCI|nr:transmembrane and ubiquitin-like domain-containing protein 1 [Phallusia mammillata]
MSSYLIDGIGDEVTLLITSAFVVIMLTVAWMSTRVTDNSYDQFMAGRQQRQQQQTTNQATNEPPTPAPNDTTEPTESVTTEDSSSVSDSEPVHVPDQQFDNTEMPEGHFLIRLKFMDESIKTIRVKPSDTISEIRRRSFPANTADRYRLIYRGQVLRNSSQTIQECNILSTDSPVVHCFLSAEPARSNQPSSASQQLQQAVDDLNMGHFFMPLFGSVLALLWYVCIFHTSLFSLPSVFGIIGLTCFYIVLIANQFF